MMIHANSVEVVVDTAAWDKGKAGTAAVEKDRMGDTVVVGSDKPCEDRVGTGVVGTVVDMEAEEAGTDSSR